MRKKCFTLFANTKVKNDINQGGMGLGLAASSMICKSLRGHVNLIRTEIDGGSKFNLIIPVLLGEKIESAEPIIEEELESKNQILLTDVKKS